MEETETTTTQDVWPSETSATDVSTGTEEKVPEKVNGSVGAILSIAIILTMIVIGAFYSWGQRIAEQQSTVHQSNTQ